MPLCMKTLSYILSIAAAVFAFGLHAETNDPVGFAAGGGTSSGDGYILSHTLGEGIIGTSGGNNFSLGAGFWEVDSETTSNVDLRITADLTGPLVTTENIARGLTLRVTNRTALTATSVQLLIHGPPGLRIIEATNSGGTAQLQGVSNVTCQVSSLASNAGFTLQLTLRPNFLSATSPLIVSLGNLTAVASTSEPDDNFTDNFLVFAATVVPQTDWGDARGGFPVTPAENGAYHRYSPTAPWLGVRWDNDGTGNHSPQADFDDTHGLTDDEDSVEFITPLIPGSNATVVVTATAPGFLDAWSDFYRNTNWSDGGEQIFASRPLVAGSNTLIFPVPWNAVSGTTTARWRISTTGGLSYTGYGGVGEVEDHTATITPPTIVDFGGVPHQSLGGAAVSVGSNGLTLSNLGTNGQDGAVIGLQELSRTVSLSFGSNGFRLPSLARLSVAAYGTISGTPDQLLGSVTLANSNGLVSGFWPGEIGWPWPQSRRIEVYDGSTLVGSFPVPQDGSIGTFSGDVRLTETSFVAETGQDSFWWYDWDDWVYTPPGQPTTLNGNRLRLVYVGSADQIDNLARLVLTGSNIDSLLIEDETAPRFQPQLRTDLTGETLGVKWDTRSAILQTAPTMSGPWTDVVEGTNSFQIVPSAGTKFFRVLVKPVALP